MKIYPEKVFPLLIPSLSDPSQPVRVSAMQAIQSFGEDARPHFERWMHALSDEDGSVRRVAMEALFTAHIDEEKILHTLVRKLTDRENGVQESAVLRLGRLGSLARPAIPHIKPFLSHDEPSMQVAAAYSMWQIDADLEEEAAIVLLKWKDHPNQWIQEKVYRSLWKMNAEKYEAPKELKAKILSSTVPGFQRMGIKLFLEMDSAALDWVPLLCDMLEGKDDWDRGTAIRILGGLGGVAVKALPQLRQLAMEPNFEVQWTARQAIKTIESASNK